MTRVEIIYALSSIFFLAAGLVFARTRTTEPSLRRPLALAMGGTWIALAGIILEGNEAAKNLALVLCFLQALITYMTRKMK